MKRAFVLTDKPPLEVQKEEAREKSVELLSATNDRCYGYYKLSCGHTTFLHYGAVRKAKTVKFKCEVCFDAKLTAEAESAGLIYNKNSALATHSKRSYTYKSCGHTRTIEMAVVRTGGAKCPVCLEESYHQDAKNQGIKLLDQSSDSPGRRYYELGCGHIKLITIGSVREGSWLCRVCQEDKYSAEALENGIEMLKDVKASRPEHRTYRLGCGCIKEITPACVRLKSFECKNHSERFIDFTKSISVYIVKFILPIGDFVKVGFAMDVPGRLVRYGLNGDAELLEHLPFENGEHAVAFEKHLHNKYLNLCVDKEVLRPHMKNGFTECYPFDLLKTFTSEFETKKREIGY
jgi:hypothetical protein